MTHPDILVVFEASGRRLSGLKFAVGHQTPRGKYLDRLGGGTLAPESIMIKPPSP
jgi:hypothetical protein